MFLLTCLLRGMTLFNSTVTAPLIVSTHMPLARHDDEDAEEHFCGCVSTHMPLARHDVVVIETQFA